jgi:hypothetical protein
MAQAVQQAARPRGVAVRLDTEHLCAVMQGTEKQPSQRSTSAFAGEFQSDLRRRLEFFEALASENRASAPDGLSARVRPEPPRPVPRGTYPRRIGPPPSRQRP